MQWETIFKLTAFSGSPQGPTKECRARHEHNFTGLASQPAPEQNCCCSSLLLDRLKRLCANKHPSPPIYMNSTDPGPRRRRISTCLSPNMIQVYGCLPGIKGHVNKIWLWFWHVGLGGSIHFCWTNHMHLNLGCCMHKWTKSCKISVCNTMSLFSIGGFLVCKKNKTKKQNLKMIKFVVKFVYGEAKRHRNSWLLEEQHKS